MGTKKVAVVTGASKGIGLSIVKALLKNKFEVWGIAREKPDEELGKNFHFVPFDLKEKTKIKSLAAKLPEKIDLVVNDAGVWQVVRLENVTTEQFNWMMDVNFRAPVFLTLALLPKMQKDGIIVNISSEMGIITDKGYGIYSASKAALDRFTTTLAKERRDLLVVGILPAAVDTPGARKAYHYQFDPTRLTAAEVAGVVMDAIAGKFATGSLVLVYNNENLPYWESRDRFTVVNVDKR